MAKKRQLYEYKGDCCAYCGLSVQEMVDRFGTVERMFEFNHVNPCKKDPNYENLIRRVISSEQLDEIDKCVLLCRQCHGILHAQGIFGNLQFTVKVAERKASQTLQGQVIIDKKEHRVTFLSNERILVIPYHLKIGDQDPKLYFGNELENEDIFQKYLHQLPEIKTISVMSHIDSRVLMHIEHIAENHMKMVYDVGFQILTAELFGDRMDRPSIWVRNGVALTKEGQVIYGGTVTFEGMLTCV